MNNLTSIQIDTSRTKENSLLTSEEQQPFCSIVDQCNWAVQSRIPNLKFDIVFLDASHANCCDGGSSVGGHIIFLFGIENRAAAIAWSCAKIKTVVKSTLAAEMLNLSEALDNAIRLKEIISELNLAKELSIKPLLIIN